MNDQVVRKDVYDVVIVGSGVAGLTAALAASHAGLRPVVLEKTGLIGGASCFSYGALWFGDNSFARAAGIKDDADSVAAYLNFMGGGENDPARTAALLNNTDAALQFYATAGIELALMSGVNDVYHGKAPGAVTEGRTFEPVPIAGARLGAWRDRLRTPPGEEWRMPKSIMARLPNPAAVEAALTEAVAADQLAQGAALVAQLLAALLARSVPLLTDCAVTALLRNAGPGTGGHVSGVQTADGREFAAEYGVVLATGNYLADLKLVSGLDKLPGYRSWYPPTNSGDGLRLAAEIGGAIGTTRNNVAIMLGYEDPTDASSANVGAPSVRELPRAHTMVVNRAGQRFGNEGVFQELSIGLRAFDIRTRQPANLPCWFIFDQNYANVWGLAGSVPGSVPDWVMRADTLAALAEQAGIDPGGLTAQAARLNGFAAAGVDEDFAKKPGWAMTPGSGGGKNPSLGAIDTAPFYAVPLFPTLGVAGAGLRADGAARVLNWQGAPVAGLYAAGDVALHDEFGTGYQAGVTFAAAITFGMIAARELAGGRVHHGA